MTSIFTSKRGAVEAVPGAGAASTLIGVILLILVFYVILIPPADRAELLGENNTFTGVSSSRTTGTTLLDEEIGLLSFVEDRTIEHEIPNARLFQRQNAQELLEVNTFVIRGGIVSGVNKEVRFPLSPSTVENTFLSFQAPIRQGVLKITLNGFDLFEGTLTSSTPPAITVRNDLLRSDNVLVFSVSGSTFDDKTYEITDLKIIGDILNRETQRASETFVLSREEFSNLESADLRFYVECDQQDVGVLTIRLNGNEVYAATPVCESDNKVDLSKEDFARVRNELDFTSSRGGISINTIRVSTRLEETKPFIGYFLIGNELFNNFENRDRELVIEIKFVDDREDKEADLTINGVLARIDQRDAVYRKNITVFAEEGNNYVELTPRKELNIVQLRVFHHR